MTFTRKLLDAAVPVALVCSALIVSPGAASAQGHYPYRLGADSEPRPFVRRRGLSSEADQAVADLKSVGHWNRVCLENISASFEFFGCDPFLQGLNNGFTAPFISEAAWIWGVPRSEWVKDTALVPSLKNITCGNSPCGLFGGYTVSDINENGADDEDAADNSLGFHAAGVQSTQDKSCTDNTNSIGAGNPLLAGSDCPKTWGAEGWKGARKIPQALYLQQFLLDPNNFSFEPTAISDAQLDAAGVPNDTTARIGDFQTYGFTSDYSKDILCGTSVFRSYGNVIPANSPATGGAACNTAAPTRSGWPLGIQVRADAFTFQFPKLKEIAYYQLVFTNKSRDVYNVPLDYDSLYISLNNGWFANGNIQQNPEYVALDKGTEYIVTGPFQPCDNSRAVSDINCARWGGPGVVIGLNQGATAVIMLHSPIGDLRNKLFTRAGNPFFNPANIHAGDTLTYNIHHFCGFRACTRNTFATDPSITPDHEMRAFGMISSIEKYVYGARVAGSFTDQVYWHTFRPFGFPTRCDDTQFPVATPAGCGFSHWVPPGNWDWNHDGILDTLHIDECNTNGCVAAFGDTFPNGKLNGYSNVGGQIAVGPLHLLADSSVSFTFAMTTIQANDAAGLAAQVSAAIDNYMGFYTTPKPAPACRVTAARRFTTGDGVPGAQIVWDNSCFPKAWTDAFLAGQASAIGAAPPNTPNGNLRVLNPWLADTLNKL
ncbi:MAG TPA: hypothetical protein VFK78_07820, partial [Gemmatimonadales bacterium]|nr:hypothetical protein [Gemmatimonadales bacterium]